MPFLNGFFSLWKRFDEFCRFFLIKEVGVVGEEAVHRFHFINMGFLKSFSTPPQKTLGTAIFWSNVDLMVHVHICREDYISLSEFGNNA